MSSNPWQWSHEYGRYFRYEIRNGRSVCVWAQSLPAYTKQTFDNGSSYSTSRPTPTQGPAVDPNMKSREHRYTFRGTPVSGLYEDLDSSYRVRTKAEEYTFFRVGRVFALLWSEPAGVASTGRTMPGGSHDTINPNSSIVEGRFGQKILCQIRRFVVMKVSRSQHFVEACAITTYGNRGCLKPGCNAAAHTIIHTQGHQPQYVQGEYERGMTKQPIAVEPGEQGDYMSSTSRLRFGKTYTIECNMKVRDMGMVIPEHRSRLRRYYEDERDKQFEPDDPTDVEGSDSNSTQFTSGHLGSHFTYSASGNASDDRVETDKSTTTANTTSDILRLDNDPDILDASHVQSEDASHGRFRGDHTLVETGQGSSDYNVDITRTIFDGVPSHPNYAAERQSYGDYVAPIADTISKATGAGNLADDAHTDSGYASHSRQKEDHLSITLDTILETHNVDDAGADLGDVQSVMSDHSDIDSIASKQTSWREQEGKSYVAQMLALNDALQPLCKEALDTMGRQRFITNVRRILKAYYRNLFQDAHTERERVCVDLLRSRSGRQRMSLMMADIIASKDDDQDGIEQHLVKHHRDMEMINTWLESSHNTHLTGSQATAFSPEAQAFEGVDEAYSSDGSDDSCAEMVEFLYLHEMTQFFCDTRSFRILLNEFKVLCFPARIRDILLSNPADRLWISTENDMTLTNRVKSWVEDYTELRWDWWPLQPRLRRLKEDQVRLFTICSCGALTWTEISTASAKLLLEKLPKIDARGLRQSRCRIQKGWSQRCAELRKLASTLAPSRSSQRYTPPSGTSASSTSAPSSHLGSVHQSANPAQQQQQQQPGNQNPITTPGPSTATSTHQLALPKHWVLLGVKSLRPSLEISHIPIHQQTTDRSFYESLRQEYQKSRGRVLLWFSFWRLSYCEVVKFKCIAQDWVIKDRKDLPKELEYIYTPRPPNAENPPIPEHEFGMMLNACTEPCRWWKPFHNCGPQAGETSTIQKIPKKDERHTFETESRSEKHVYAWGLKAIHAVSARHVLLYHVIIFTIPFGFWGWWMTGHPGDLQGAAVPATLVMGLLSIFWSTNGILTKGRHGSKSVQD